MIKGLDVKYIEFQNNFLLNLTNNIQVFCKLMVANAVSKPVPIIGFV